MGKVILEADIGNECERLKAMGSRVVLTNGCFDLLHPGHVHHLRMAKRQGDKLVVAVNDDESVRALKGPGRPIFEAGDRAFMLAELECVTYVTIFAGVRCTNIIKRIRPTIYIKGGDYVLETLDPEERAALEECGATITFLPMSMFTAGEWRSTSDIIRHIAGMMRGVSEVT